RIDRVPGQPDRTKAGLSRVFDDFLETPTFLFVRGDEANPDTSRPLRPATPVVLGGEVKIAPVSLSPTAACPDKRAFVIDEALDGAQKAVAQACLAADEAMKRVKQTDKALADATEADRKAEAKVNATSEPEGLRGAQAEAAGAIEALAHAERTARD